jgi:hypothetical protein
MQRPRPTLILSLYLGPPDTMYRLKLMAITEQAVNPFSPFLYALKASKLKDSGTISYELFDF